MKVLVTGGAGFIGSRTIRKLLKKGLDIVCLDNFNDYYDPAVKEKNISGFTGDIKLYRADIRNPEQLEKIFYTEKIEKICHIAAMAGVRPSMESPSLYEETNVSGTLNLLKAAKKYEINHFIQTSSSSVYGNSKGEVDELSSADFPISPYAATKRAAELLTYSYHHLYKINCTVLRLFTVYGPSGRPDMSPYIFTKAILKGQEIKKFGDGSTKRDYTYIDDITDGIVAALERVFPFETINLGNNQPVELNYFIGLLEELTGKKAMIKQCASQPGDVDITFANINKAGQLLGYNPKTTIREGMNKFIQWFQENYY
jgi:UDP-glucuronate 4-epimerase